MKTMYRVSRYGGGDIIEVTRETDISVWYMDSYGREVRSQKHSQNERWYDTQEEALAEFHRMIEQRKKELRKIEKLYAEFQDKIIDRGLS